MARMIPAHPRADASRRNHAIFEVFRTELSDQWTAIHGAAWVARVGRDGTLHDGQVDWVLAHRDYGILALNLIEGGLLCDPSAQSWTVPGPDGVLRRIADPYASARTSSVALVGKLGEHPQALPSQPSHGYGVLIPDALVPPRGFAAHASADITIDRQGFSRLAESVVQLAQRWAIKAPATGNAPTRWWWQALEDLFLAPREARTLLNQRLADDHAAMVALSPQQFGVLDLLGRVRRQTVYGPAGTGKTLLAMPKARLLARQGMRVLLTCYNKALGQHMRQAMADEPGVTTAHFHEACYEVGGLDRSKVKAPQGPDAAVRLFFDAELPQRMQQAGQQNGPAFDAVIVDEAQDFLASYWRALDAWLINPEQAVRYLFYDDAQRLRPDAAPVPGADQALVLTTNWRNTQAIHAHLALVEPAMASARCLAPPGVAVQHELGRPNPGRALKRVLQRLCGEGGVKPADVVVLTGRSSKQSIYRDFEEVLKPWRLRVGDSDGQILLTSIQAFKGMEAPVVVLTELDHLTSAEARVLHYVGASRATALLVIMDDAEVTP